MYKEANSSLWGFHLLDEIPLDKCSPVALANFRFLWYPTDELAGSLVKKGESVHMLSYRSVIVETREVSAN